MKRKWFGQKPEEGRLKDQRTHPFWPYRPMPQRQLVFSFRLFEHLEKHQNHTYRDSRVGNIKGRPCICVVPMPIDKIDNIPKAQAIDKITNCSA